MFDSKERMARLRAKLNEDEEKKKNRGKPMAGGDNASYPFFNIPEGSVATVRFVPDADEDNAYFWKDRLVIRLPFQGVSGGDYPTSEKVIVTVPCVEMFGDVCPIITHTRPWWKDLPNGSENPMKPTARLYYKRKSFIMAGFVVSSPFEETSVPENPIRRIISGPGMLEKIKIGCSDPDMEHFPTDYFNGFDFRIRKTKKQNYNNYDTSEWARRSRALTETEMEAINTHGLYDLKQFLGARPDKDGIAEIKAMFMASLNGDPFDHDSFGAHYRPFADQNGEAADNHDSAIRTESAGSATRTQVSMATSVAAAPEQPDLLNEVKDVEAKIGSDKPAPEKNPQAQDIVASLRARVANRASTS